MSFFRIGGHIGILLSTFIVNVFALLKNIVQDAMYDLNENIGFLCILVGFSFAVAWEELPQ